ncbi:hypothetical protein GCM10020220_107870 [Nonomuraea rubra]|uniref:hypothetical protein n=1 Tax=Nonomuraea rubra TaxID=46180 RepID=UPI0031E896EB
MRQARRSLDMDSRYVRGRMFNLSLLAAGLLQCGELEEACTAAAGALALAAELQSARGRGRTRPICGSGGWSRTRTSGRWRRCAERHARAHRRVIPVVGPGHARAQRGVT